MTKEYWPDGLVDEYTPESLGEPEKWLAILLTPDDVASEAEKDDDEYAAVRGKSKVGDTVRFDTFVEWAPIVVKITADKYEIINGTVPAEANQFAPQEDYESAGENLDETIAAYREAIGYEPGDEFDVAVSTWGSEWWQIRSATEIVQVEAPETTDEAVDA